MTSEENDQMFEGFKLREFLSQINKCKEKDQPIEIKGFGFNNCPYAQIMEDEKSRLAKNKKDAFHDAIFVEKQFLKS